MAKAKPTDTWIIQKDEFHPDPREAAKHADQRAREMALDVYQRRLKRLQDKPTALDPGEAKMFMFLKDEIVAVKAAIDEHKEDA